MPSSLALVVGLFLLSLIGNISSNASSADLEMPVLLLFLDEGMDCALKLWQASFTELLFIFFAEKNCLKCSFPVYP